MSAASHLINRLPQASRPFHAGSTEECILCIRAGSHSLSVAVYDEAHEKFLEVGDYLEVFALAQAAPTGTDGYFPHFFAEVAHEASFFDKPFRSVRIAWEGERCTMIPSGFYSETETEVWLSFQARTGQDDLVLSSRLHRPDAVEVFSVPREVRDTLAGRFGKMELFHVSAPLIGGILSDHSNDGEGHSMFLNTRDHWFDLVILEGNRLMYHNIFPWQEPADVAYYLLYVIQQFHLDPERTPLHLMGRTSPGDPLYKLLLRYITKASFAAAPPGSPFATLPEKVAYHTYFSLLNLTRCGS